MDSDKKTKLTIFAIVGICIFIFGMYLGVAFVGPVLDETSSSVLSKQLSECKTTNTLLDEELNSLYLVCPDARK